MVKINSHKRKNKNHSHKRKNKNHSHKRKNKNHSHKRKNKNHSHKRYLGSGKTPPPPPPREFEPIVEFNNNNYYYLDENECYYFTDVNDITVDKSLDFGNQSFVFVGIVNNYKIVLKITNPQIILDANHNKYGMDSVIYEYFVGLYINTLLDNFPCFIQTLGLYNATIENATIENATIENATIENATKLNYRNIGDINECNSIDETILALQYVDAKSLKNSDIPTNEIFYVIIQIFFVLSFLYKNDGFKHNDLHSGNILLYNVGHGKYIDFNYHLENKVTCNFKSNYVAKLIDYGEATYKDTKQFYEKMCIGKQTTFFSKNDPLCNEEKCIHYGSVKHSLEPKYNYGDNDSFNLFSIGYDILNVRNNVNDPYFIFFKKIISLFPEQFYKEKPDTNGQPLYKMNDDNDTTKKVTYKKFVIDMNDIINDEITDFFTQPDTQNKYNGKNKYGIMNIQVNNTTNNENYVFIRDNE